MSTLIGIDLGTASIKGAVLDLDALRVASVHRESFPEPLGGLPDLFCEFDPLEVSRRVRAVITALLPHAPGCAGIVACGQMGGLVLCDQHGNPHSNYISWRDQRLLMMHRSGGTYWDLFTQRINDVDRRVLGNEVRPGLPASFLYWLAVRGHLPAEPLIASSLPDFVLANLCGTRPATHITNAVGAVNLESSDWHRDMFMRLGYVHLEWPTLADLREPAGWFEIGGGRLPWHPPAGDHQTALAGALLAAGELSINISTGSQLSRLASRLEYGNYQVRPFFDGLFLNTITHIPAGRALNVLVALLTELAETRRVDSPDVWEYIARASAAAPETDLEVDLAFFPSPVGERGAIRNIREGNLTVGTLFLAAFRAMAENYDLCAARLAPARDWERVVFSGGLAHLPRLRRMIVERLGAEYRFSETMEDTLLGLLVLGLTATGRDPTVQAAAKRLAARPG